MNKRLKLALILGCAGISALSTPVYATVKDGVDAWTRGEYAIAIKEWRGPALAGDTDAQFNMGQAYKLGRGVTADNGIALDWFRKASANGHVRASDNYGLLLFQNNRFKEAVPYLEASAARGEPRAQYVIGAAYFNGEFVKRDWVRAYALMIRSSSQGLPQATQSLKQMDQHIPLDQRQEGVALAGKLEQDAIVKQKSLTAGFPVQTARKPDVYVANRNPAIQSTRLPPSSVAAPKPRFTAPIPAVIQPSTPTPSARIAAVTAPPKTTITPRTRSSSGPWRVQLGAFGSQAQAKTLWTKLSNKTSGLNNLQPYLVAAGSFTRLQAGPFASRNAANRICNSLKSSGQACFPVKK